MSQVIRAYTYQEIENQKREYLKYSNWYIEQRMRLEFSFLPQIFIPFDKEVSLEVVHSAEEQRLLDALEKQFSALVKGKFPALNI